MKLNDGVTKFNVASLLLAIFGGVALLSLQIDFFSYLFDAHFGLEDEEAAEAIGDIDFAATLASITFETVLGTIMDLVGRKGPTVSGLVLTCVMTILVPFPRKLAWLYAIRCFINIGVQPLIQSPYASDYIALESQGLIGAYYQILTTVAAILGSTVAILIERSIGIDYVYWILGGFVLILAIVVCFGLNDIKIDKKKTKKDITPELDQQDRQVVPSDQNQQ